MSGFLLAQMLSVFVEQVGFAENEAEIKVILGVDPRFREDDSPERAVDELVDIRKADSICAGMTVF
ncbi:MAG TPA: hypothetical protein VLL52_11675 [Anaerolineae bacterium]|nr:hypothetical protein [Anaerolineae bacterium]